MGKVKIHYPPAQSGLFEPLLDITTTTATQQVDLDVSRFALSDYEKLVLDIPALNHNPGQPYLTIYMTLNNIDGSIYGTGADGSRGGSSLGSITVSEFHSASLDKAAYRFEFLALGERILCLKYGIRTNYYDMQRYPIPSTGVSSVLGDSYGGVSAQSLTSINFKGEIPVGTRFILRGMKK